MIAMADLLQIAASGLSAATQGMQVVSNNTANVNTPGYNAQSLTQTELVGAPGGVGVGTEVTAIARAFDQFVSQQVTSASAATRRRRRCKPMRRMFRRCFRWRRAGQGALVRRSTASFRRQTSSPPIRRALPTAPLS